MTLAVVNTPAAAAAPTGDFDLEGCLADQSIEAHELSRAEFRVIEKARAEFLRTRDLLGLREVPLSPIEVRELLHIDPEFALQQLDLSRYSSIEEKADIVKEIQNFARYGGHAELRAACRETALLSNAPMEWKLNILERIENLPHEQRFSWLTRAEDYGFGPAEVAHLLTEHLRNPKLFVFIDSELLLRQVASFDVAGHKQSTVLILESIPHPDAETGVLLRKHLRHILIGNKLLPVQKR